MQTMSSVKKAVITALCIALCYVMPIAFHAFGAGSVLCPMHIPVLICGLICGWQYGLLCGLAGPAISSALGGMPTAADLPAMMTELAIYGFVSGLLIRLIRTRSTYADLYLAMIAAMILGRVAAGIVKAWIFTTGEAYTLRLWATAHLVTSLPGILIQLVFIPSIVFALMKARLIPARYPKKNT